LELTAAEFFRGNTAAVVVRIVDDFSESVAALDHGLDSLDATIEGYLAIVDTIDYGCEWFGGGGGGGGSGRSGGSGGSCGAVVVTVAVLAVVMAVVGVSKVDESHARQHVVTSVVGGGSPPPSTWRFIW
jgi:hypothetical protein